MKECPYPECSTKKFMEASIDMVNKIEKSNLDYRAEIKEQIKSVDRGVDKLVSANSSMAVMMQRAMSANELVTALIKNLDEKYKDVKGENENIFTRLRELEGTKANEGMVEKLREEVRMFERNMLTKGDVTKLLGAFAIVLTIIQVIIAIVR